jgi:hypothetical protein
LADASVVESLRATGKRRQNFNLYGLGELLLEIFLMSHASIDQYRAEPNDPIEARIRPILASESKGLSDGESLDYLLRDPCSGLSRSPVTKANGHHCVSLKHALRPYRGGLKAGTDNNP